MNNNTNWNRYIGEANMMIIDYDNDYNMQCSILRAILDELRIFHNIDPENFDWPAISDWYVSQQRLIHKPYIDTSSLLYPSMFLFGMSKENCDFSFSRDRILKEVEKNNKNFDTILVDHFELLTDICKDPEKIKKFDELAKEVQKMAKEKKLEIQL